MSTASLILASLVHEGRREGGGANRLSGQVQRPAMLDKVEAFFAPEQDMLAIEINRLYRISEHSHLIELSINNMINRAVDYIIPHEQRVYRIFHIDRALLCRRIFTDWISDFGIQPTTEMIISATMLRPRHQLRVRQIWIVRVDVVHEEEERPRASRLAAPRRYASTAFTTSLPGLVTLVSRWFTPDTG